jgi:hypothetical protein
MVYSKRGEGGVKAQKKQKLSPPQKNYAMSAASRLSNATIIRASTIFGCRVSSNCHLLCSQIRGALNEWAALCQPPPVDKAFIKA